MLFKWRFEQCPSNVDGVCTLRQRGSGIKKKDSRPLLFEDKSEKLRALLVSVDLLPRIDFIFIFNVPRK
jgi:hypothetical protein